MAKSLVRMVRALVSFGAMILRDPECERLRTVLHGIIPTSSKVRTQTIADE
jgi:hypothetical protein